VHPYRLSRDLRWTLPLDPHPPAPKAEKQARVEVWPETSGTASLAGRDLRPADVIAAAERINSLAQQLKAAGIDEGLDRLRARAYIALLLGYPVPSQPPAATSQCATGSVNLTMPIASWFGASEEPGEVAGFGPVAAAEGRALADRLAGGRSSRWCLTLTGQDGQAVAHGCARAARSDATARGWELTLTIRHCRPGLACTHGNPLVASPRPRCGT